MRNYANKKPMIYSVIDDYVECINPNVQPNCVFIIDLEDLDKIKGEYWVYGVRQYIRSFKHRLHRYLMNAPKGMVVDHWDNDKSNNRKSNLRICTQQQNCFNQSMRSNNSSGYRGVSWHKSRNKWKADIRINGKTKYIGCYNTKEEAALAYNEKAKELFGEFAKLNIINI